jgi:hypothetical protein
MTSSKFLKLFSPLFNQEQTLNNPTLEDLNSIAQTFFLRKAGTERKDISQNSRFNQFIDTKDLFKKLALLKTFSLKTHGTIIF